MLYTIVQPASPENHDPDEHMNDIYYIQITHECFITTYEIHIYYIQLLITYIQLIYNTEIIYIYIIHTEYT